MNRIVATLKRWAHNRSINDHRIWEISRGNHLNADPNDKKSARIVSLKHPLGFLVWVYVPKIWREMPGINMTLDAAMIVQSACSCDKHVEARAAVYAKHGEQSPELAFLS